MKIYLKDRNLILEVISIDLKSKKVLANLEGNYLIFDHTKFVLLEEHSSGLCEGDIVVFKKNNQFAVVSYHEDEGFFLVGNKRNRCGVFNEGKDWSVVSFVDNILTTQIDYDLDCITELRQKLWI
jgi:hypothetical protein